MPRRPFSSTSVPGPSPSSPPRGQHQPLRCTSWVLLPPALWPQAGPSGEPLRGGEGDGQAPCAAGRGKQPLEASHEKALALLLFLHLTKTQRHAGARPRALGGDGAVPRSRCEQGSGSPPTAPAQAEAQVDVRLVKRAQKLLKLQSKQERGEQRLQPEAVGVAPGEGARVKFPPLSGRRRVRDGRARVAEVPGAHHRCAHLGAPAPSGNARPPVPWEVTCLWRKPGAASVDGSETAEPGDGAQSQVPLSKRRPVWETVAQPRSTQASRRGQSRSERSVSPGTGGRAPSGPTRGARVLLEEARFLSHQVRETPVGLGMLRRPCKIVLRSQGKQGWGAGPGPRHCLSCCGAPASDRMPVLGFSMG